MTPEASREDAWIKLAAWIEVHRQRLFIALGAVIVAVAAWYFTRLARENAEASAGRQLLELTARSGTPAPVEDFLRLAETAGGTRAGKHARLLAAERLFRDGKFAEAQAEFERALAISPDGVLAPQAAFGIAASLDAQDKLPEAEAKYREVLARHPEQAAAREARLALARLLESKDQPEQALRLYDELIHEPQQGVFAMEARARRESLVRRHPQLASAAPASALPVSTGPLSLTAPAP
ncbi:MAG TPA: tetratricopeptide repeat protein [Verrucomicrobiota bacterium]|nr:tetratricopeptide repeat protein [Verrucomicrobiota bacterium]